MNIEYTGAKLEKTAQICYTEALPGHMNFVEIGIYPFLFAAIYFEVFLLVTFLSKPARAMRRRATSERTPSVAIIVPCYNEGTTIEGTVRSLLDLSYPADKLSVVLVDDGSTDDTARVMAQFSSHPQVTVLTQKNGGKHTALNLGIETVKDAELVGCLDADSFVEPNALREIISCFDDEKVGAATSAIAIHQPRTVLEHMQSAEFVLGIALRHILASINGLYVTPGPLSIYRRDLLVQLGGFRHGHNTEDMEMALRIQRAGFAIDNAPLARVLTKAPNSIPALVKQRTRWTTGFLRNMLYDYRDMVGNRNYGALGLLILPIGFFGIVGGIVIAGLTVYQLSANAISTYLLSSGVPFEYTLSTMLPNFSSLEWFYIPVTLLAVLSFVGIIGVIVFALIGRGISKTNENLSGGILAYIFLHGLLAPFWFARALVDVAAGTKRSWR